MRRNTLLEAADADECPGYQLAASGQEDDRRRDVARLAETAERGVAEQPLAKLGFGLQSFAPSVSVAPGLTALTPDVAQAELDGGTRVPVERGLGR
jgi:hypothetical protein